MSVQMYIVCFGIAVSFVIYSIDLNYVAALTV